MSTHRADTAAWPREILWGASTSPHQVEGNNTRSDWWQYETASGSPLPEASGDACDSFHRWGEDMDLLRDAGLNAYRFGIEWARIEPREGVVDDAALEHYAAMIAGARARGLHPVLTLHHFTHPAWFAARGGWTHPEATAAFLAHVRRFAPLLRDAAAVVTINEPNIVAIMHRVLSGQASLASGLGGGLPLPDAQVGDVLIGAHHAAVDLLHELVPGVPVGWSVAQQVVRSIPGGEALAAQYREAIEDRFVRAAEDDDFLGVQAYTRTVFGPDGKLPADHAGAPVTMTGWEYHPEAVAEAVDDVRSLLPDIDLLVTENGIATDDDAQRVAYLTGALAALDQRVRDGARFRGYLHWSLLDNYEWGSWHPRFGLVSVDRDHGFTRTAHPSLAWLGSHARTRMSAPPSGTDAQEHHDH